MFATYGQSDVPGERFAVYHSATSFILYAAWAYVKGKDTASTAPLAINVYVYGAGTDIFVAPSLTIAVPTPPPALTLIPLKSDNFKLALN